MFLLLGDPGDACCRMVQHALHSHNREARILSYPLAHPQRASWWLETNHSQSQLIYADGTLLPDTAIEGVLVRDAWIDTQGWQADDLLYMQAEAQAALLGWLWSLECSVVNQYTPDIWNRRHVPLPLWGPALRRCGLVPIEQFISTSATDLHAFGMNAAIYAPLTDPARYQLTEDSLAGLAKLTQYAPICLIPAYKRSVRGCIAGDVVIWEEPMNDPALDQALCHFASEIGLPFLEIELAATDSGMRVLDVVPFPNIGRFGPQQQQAIAEHLANMLIAERSQ